MLISFFPDSYPDQVETAEMLRPVIHEFNIIILAIAVCEASEIDRRIHALLYDYKGTCQA